MTERGGDITLHSGRQISLRELRQTLVYEGLLEGLPTQKMNNRIINEAVLSAKERLPSGNPILIPPKVTPIERPTPYPFVIPAAIPVVQCVGRFHSLETVRDSSMDYSECVLVWFQDSFALPIDADVLLQIQQSNWDANAADLEW